MPVAVTCPGCYRTFRVADAFAGRRGRCPYCDAAIDVPGDSVADAGAVRPAEAAAWAGFARGLSWVQAAFALGVILELLTVLGEIRKAEAAPGRPADEAAAVIGLAAFFVLAAAIVLLVIGRGLGVNAPDPSARALARASTVFTLTSIGFLLVTFVGLVALVAPAGPAANGVPPAPGDPAGLLALVGCSMLFFVAAGLLAEWFCQRSLVHVAERFDDKRLRRWARRMGAATLFLFGLFVITAGLAIAAAIEEVQQAQNNPGLPAPPPDGDVGEEWVGFVGIAITLVYLGCYLVTLQLAKKAIRRDGDERGLPPLPDC